MSDEMLECAHGRFALGSCAECMKTPWGVPSRDDTRGLITVGCPDIAVPVKSLRECWDFVVEGMGVAFPHMRVQRGEVTRGIEADGRIVDDVVRTVANALVSAWCSNIGGG